MTCEPSPRSSVKEKLPNLSRVWFDPAEQIRALTERALAVSDAQAGLFEYFNENMGYMVNAVYDVAAQSFSRLDTDAPAFWLDFSNGNLVEGSDQYGVTLWVAAVGVPQPFTEFNSVNGWQRIAQWNADGSTEAVIYELAAFIPDTYDASQILFAHVFTDAVDFEQNMSGLAGAEVASTGTAVVNVTKNGTSIGSLTYTASATGVLSVSATSFAVGDVLRFVAPASADATLSGVRLNIVGKRS